LIAFSMPADVNEVQRTNRKRKCINNDEHS
jgi:hypothetical protein